MLAGIEVESRLFTLTKIYSTKEGITSKKIQIVQKSGEFLLV